MVFETNASRLWNEVLSYADGAGRGPAQAAGPLPEGPIGHPSCAPIITEAAPTAQLHSSHLFSGTCRRTASVKGTGLEQIQRELNTLQLKLGNSRQRGFPHALINAHYTGAFSFSGIVQQPRTHGGSYSLLKHEQVQQIFANENPRGRTSPR